MSGRLYFLFTGKQQIESTKVLFYWLYYIAKRNVKHVELNILFLRHFSSSLTFTGKNKILIDFVLWRDNIFCLLSTTDLSLPFASGDIGSLNGHS